MLIRRVARAIAWTLAAVVLLAVVLYVVLVAINWRDEAPSAQALQMQRIIDDRPVVGDADNAYVFLLGLAVPEDQDPLAWGRKRMAFLDAFPGPAADDADFPGQDHDFAAHRAPSTSTLIEACREPDQACLDELEHHPESVDQWLASEGWLLGRYLDLIRLTQWRESIPADARVSFPSYAPALDGQRLLLMTSSGQIHVPRGGSSSAQRSARSARASVTMPQHLSPFSLGCSYSSSLHGRPIGRKGSGRPAQPR